MSAGFPRFRVPPLALFLLASFATGVATLPLRTAIEPPSRNLEELEGMGQNVLIGTLGGLRALLADFLWIRTNYYWERKNIGLSETTSRLVTRLQPDYAYFWIDTARMIVYDIPVWRFGSRRAPPPTVEKRIRREQAERGIELLNEAQQFLPDSPRIAAEKARIYWTVLGDPEKAEEAYKKAYEMPGGSALYARLRAVILMDEGREEEALEWLEKVLADLTFEENPAQYSLMREYVEELRAGRNPREEAESGRVSPGTEGEDSGGGQARYVSPVRGRLAT